MATMRLRDALSIGVLMMLALIGGCVGVNFNPRTTTDHHRHGHPDHTNRSCGRPRIPPSASRLAESDDRIDNKIVNGVVVPSGGMPWACAIVQYSSFQYCDCTVIDRQWVVTAGHCVYGDTEAKIKRMVKIFVGVTDLTKAKEQNKRKVTLLPACLPAEPVTAIAVQMGSKRRRLCFVTGWGTLYENQNSGSGTIGSGSDHLMQTAIEMFSAGDCQEYLGAAPLSDTMICGGYDTGKYDACLGDSGGPLVCDAGDGSWTLNGIVSWGSGCAEAGKPGFYTNVYEMVPWMTQTMAAN